MKKKSNKYFILDRTYDLRLDRSIRHIVNRILAVLYKILYMFCHVEAQEKKYKVAICAIFKNESIYLREWIEFHQIVGVDHFYLYNNNSEDKYLDVLQPYIDNGVVTLSQWPQNQAQMECYKDCIARFSCETSWLGFIDIDEFVVPIEENSIYGILKPFENKRGAVKIYWKMFGTNGRIDRDTNDLVIEDFTVCWPKYYIVGKCFYNTNFGFNPDSEHSLGLHHSFWASYKGIDIPPVNVFDKICFNEVDIASLDRHPVQINHYFSKSYHEYSYKRAKGDVYFKVNPHDEEYFYVHENENIDVDFSGYKYLTKLKLALNITN